MGNRLQTNEERAKSWKIISPKKSYLLDRQAGAASFEMEQRTLFEGTRFDRSKQKGTKQKVLTNVLTQLQGIPIFE